MLGATVRGAAHHHGEVPAVVHGSQVLTWSQIDVHADTVAAALHRSGLGPGDVVGSVLPSGAEWLILAVAIDRIGAVHAPVSTHLAPPERAAAVETVDAVLTVAAPGHVNGLPLRSTVQVVEPGGLGEEFGGGRSATPGASRPAPSAPEQGERVAVVCFTSGTTGRAKGAAFGTNQLAAVSRIDLGDRADSWGGGAALLASTHFAHVGMALKLPWYARTGSTLCVMDRWNADEALELVARHRMPTIGGVAAQIALMLRSNHFDEHDLSCVERLVVGGAPSSPRLVDEARRRFGASYSIRYSSTESGGVGLATSEGADDHEALHTVGRPRPGVEVSIVDEDGRPVGPGVTGELRLRSGAVTRGYWNDAAATAAAITPDGWLRTGDLAHATSNGCVVIDGRRTDMLIRGGYNVFPVEVESILEGHPAVREVAVAARSDDVLGEVPVAVVVLTPGAPPPSLEELRSFASGDLARHKLPHDLLVVDHLPLTTGDKLDRRTLRDWVGSGPSRPGVTQQPLRN